MSGPGELDYYDQIIAQKRNKKSMTFKVYFHLFKGTDRYKTWTRLFDFSRIDHVQELTSLSREYTRQDPNFYWCAEYSEEN